MSGEGGVAHWKPHSERLGALMVDPMRGVGVYGSDSDSVTQSRSAFTPRDPR